MTAHVTGLLEPLLFVPASVAVIWSILNTREKQ